MDAADAINIMFFGKATWHIMMDFQAVEQIIQKRAMTPHERSSVLSGRYILSPDEITDLRTSGVVVYEVTQLPGDAIIIPAGCPHQVSSIMFSKHWAD